MSEKVWISNISNNIQLFDKPGVRAKFRGEEWHPARFEIPASSDRTRNILDRYARGERLEASEFPEMGAVWDEARFARVDDIFAIAGFYVVQRKLAEILHEFDLKPGGLVPCKLVQADLTTPLAGSFFFLNFGAIKETLLPEASDKMSKGSVNHKTGQQFWRISPGVSDGDVAVSSDASVGADIWHERGVRHEIFLSDKVANALKEARLDKPWRLAECRVLEVTS